MDFDVFLSYSSKDKTTADAVCAYLEQRKIRCWYAPRDIEPGADWAGSIISAIEKAKIFVLIFTDYSNSSRQVLREVNSAVGAGVPIIPFRLTENEPSGGMKYYLSTVHWLNAMNDDLELSIKHLCDMCESILTVGPSVIPASSGNNGQSTVPPDSFWKKHKKKILIACAVLVLGIGAAVFFGSRKGAEPPQTVELPSLSPELPPEEPTEEPVEETVTGPVYDTVTFVPETLDLSTVTDTSVQKNGNTWSNFVNGGYLASDGEFLYFRSNDLMKLYKTRPDGTGTACLSDQPVCSLAVLDGYIYYVTNDSGKSIRRMKKDGTEMEILYSDYGSLSDFSIADGQIYFRKGDDGLRLYSMSLDGLGLRCVNRSGCSDYAILDGKLYYSDEDDHFKLYTVELESGDPVLLKDAPVERLTLYGRYLVYRDRQKAKIFALDLDTLAEYELTSQDIMDICFDGGNLYGRLSDGDELCVIPAGKHTAVTLLPDTKIRNVCAVNGTVYFLTYHDSEAHFCDPSDGSITMTP